MRPRVLITGSSGLLGGAFVRIFKPNFEVYGVSRLSHNPNVPNEYLLNLTDLLSLKKLLEEVTPDIIIHTAAMAEVDQCETEPDKAHRTNVEVTRQLAEFHPKDKPFIYISTDSVFDGERGNYSEEDSTNPLNEYAKTKYLGEMGVMAERDNFIIARCNIFGLNDVHGVSLTEWIVTSLMSKTEIKMFTDVIFSPLYVDDIANIVKILIEKKVAGVIHLGAEKGISKYDFGVAIAEKLGLDSTLISPISVDDFEFKAKRGKNTVLNISKLKTLVEKIPTIQEGIEKFNMAYKAQRA